MSRFSEITSREESEFTRRITAQISIFKIKPEKINGKSNNIKASKKIGMWRNKSLINGESIYLTLAVIQSICRGG